MPEWVLAFSIGPVGGFIGGGRRSRDLWWGSTWVSECTLAVARALPEQGLILPSAQRMKKLLDGPSALDEGGNDTTSRRYGGRISNHVLACVEAPDRESLMTLVRTCEAAAHKHLADQLLKARRSVENRGGRSLASIRLVLDDAFFEAQVQAIRKGEFVELFAAWTPRKENLAESISSVRKLLDARKTARLFDAPATTRRGRRKSDLDAGRDSVLHPSRESDAEAVGSAAAVQHLARRRLGIGTDEELDAVGLARRIAVFRRDKSVAPGLGRLPFPPITRTAADPWLRQVSADPETRPALETVKGILREAKEDEIFFTWCSPALDPEVSWEDRNQRPECFPFDTTFLMEDGLESLEREVRRVGRRLHDRREVEETLDFLARLTKPVRDLQGAYGPPPPYFALLFMDGDGVGSAIAGAGTDAELRDLVEQLDRYADTAEPMLRERFFGRAFYVGGDDLAAYLSVDKALGAAIALADYFREHVRPAGKPLTLSAGIVLGHAKADLRALRRQAQDALSEAKKLRAQQARRDPKAAEEGWLQIVELPRSGSSRSCAGPLRELAERMQRWQDLLAEGALSLRSPHLLRGLHDRCSQDMPEERDTLGIELARYRIRAQIDRSSKGENPALQTYLENIKTWRQAEALAHELTIAARFHRIGRLRPVEAKEAAP